MFACYFEADLKYFLEGVDDPTFLRARAFFLNMNKEDIACLKSILSTSLLKFLKMQNSGNLHNS